MQSTRWVFTINNYTAEDETRLGELGSSLERNNVSYIVYGREVGAGGTPHLQGYVVFTVRRRLRAVRDIISDRGHFEVARGRSYDAAAYCKKDGRFDEYGNPPKAPKPSTPGISDFCDWIRGLETVPSLTAIANQFPGLYVRYGGARLSDLATQIMPPVLLGDDVDLRDWQRGLEVELNEDPDDRSIQFYVDSDGGTGKSWFCRYMISKYRDDVQVFSVAKRDDIAHAVDVTKRVFLFNIPRGSMEHLQYGILEMLKDRVVFSPKYNSTTKILVRKCHVVVFSNEEPDMEKLSVDRYRIKHL